MKNLLTPLNSNNITSKFFRLFTLIILSFLISCASLQPLNKTHKLSKAGLKTIHTLDVYAENDTIHALFSGIDDVSTKPTLKYLQSSNAGETWSPPVTINLGASPLKQSKRGNDFQIAAHGNTIMAIWRSKGGEPWTGKISAALSRNSGKTWKTIASPVSDKYANIDQGYFDLEADSQGRFHIVWLDDREEAGETQGLRYARFSSDTDNTEWEYHSNLEQSACTCCWSSLSSDSKGNINVLFRNDSPRDMFVTSSNNAGKSWQPAKTVWPFEWEFIGCPHQGGGIATTLQNNKLVIHNVIWNGNEKNRGLYYHALASEKKPERIGNENSSSGDIAVYDNKYVGIIYTTGDAEKKQVMVKLSDDGGNSWLEEKRLSLDGAEPSHPKIVGTTDSFLFFWTEWQENGDAIVMMSEL